MSAQSSPAAEVFAALGDPTRLALVQRLSAGGPASITRLSDGAGVTRQAVTRHLEVLEAAGLVRGLRQGRERVWQLERDGFTVAQAFLEHVSRGWDEALERLRQFVEDEPGEGGSWA